VAGVYVDEYPGLVAGGVYGVAGEYPGLATGAVYDVVDGAVYDVDEYPGFDVGAAGVAEYPVLYDGAL
jgi:hypothetical protein